MADWRVLNLGGSPFFDDPIVERGRAPPELHVARREAADAVLARIWGSAHSRHLIEGAPGTGRTSFAGYVGARAAAAGYLVCDAPVPARGPLTTHAVLLALVAALHDALLVHDAALARVPALQAARMLSRSAALRAARVGAPFATTTDDPTRRSPAEPVSTRKLGRLLRALGALASQLEDVRGVLVRVDDVDELQWTHGTAVARVLRELRDLVLALPPLHFLFMASRDNARAAIAADPSLRTIFARRILAPLSPDEFAEVLALRYAHLRFDPARPSLAPVDPDAARTLHSFFAGDTKATLRALERAAALLVARGRDPFAPLQIAQLRALLPAIYDRLADAALTPAQRSHLTVLASHGALARWTQRAIGVALDLRPSATSRIVRELRQHGYLRERSRAGESKRGRPARGYELSGAAKLATGSIGAFGDGDGAA